MNLTEERRNNTMATKKKPTKASKPSKGGKKC